MFKSIILGAVAAVAATAAFAGGMAVPIMTETDMAEEAATSSSSAGLIIPLILIALIAAALSRSSNTIQLPPGLPGGG
mgnify:CR=1 FL=1